MTIFRFSVFLGIAASAAGSSVCASPSSVTVPETDLNCSNINPQEERTCISRRRTAKEQRLKAVFTLALAAVSHSFKKYGDADNRTDPAYLKRSQAEWERFVEDDCIVKAAFGGGSNSSISDRHSDCYEIELDHRIEFLEQLASGSYGRG